MELAPIQALLARLYTDQEFRDAFIDDPELNSKSYRLEKEDLEKIIELTPDPVLHFSKTLVRKRFSQVATLLPATRRVVGRQMWETFQDFAGHYNPKGTGRHLLDAIEFSAFLTEKCQARIDAPDWWPLVLNYERTGLKALASPLFLNFKFYRHNILRLYKCAGNAEIEYAGAPQMVVWCKLTPVSKVWHQHFHPRHWPS